MTYDIIDRLCDDQILQLHALYQNEWWSRGRTLEDVRRMLDHTPLLVGLCERTTNRLIGFTRVLTDFTYRALLYDVIVDPAQRGQGLGDVLIRTVLDHPKLALVRTLELYCRPELVSFYQRLGFSDDLGDLQFMRFKREGSSVRT